MPPAARTHASAVRYSSLAPRSSRGLARRSAPHVARRSVSWRVWLAKRRGRGRRAMAQSAEPLKAKADAAFRAGEAVEAAALYGEALAAALAGGSDKAHILHANRSAALLKTGNVAGAAADALACVRLDASYTKGFYRLGAALLKAGWLQEALRAFEAGEKAAKTPAAAAEMAAGATEVRVLSDARASCAVGRLPGAPALRRCPVRQGFSRRAAA